MKPVLCLGSAPARREEIGRVLASIGYVASWVQDAAHALALLEREECPVLVDLGHEGDLESARDLRRARPWTLLVALADHSQPTATAQALGLGVADAISKLVPARQLASLLASGSRRRPTAGAQEPQGLAAIVAASVVMQPALEAIGRAVKQSDGVVICGEPGSGRHFIARAIHQEAGAGRPLVEVDCTRLAPNDGEATLTTCLHDAAGGTLLLADVALLSPRLQNRLARLLAGRGDVGAGARVMATAGPDLGVATGASRMSRDLLRAVAATRIDLPPLRRRRDDIPALVECMLSDISRTTWVPKKSIAQAALTLLASLPYGGNLRELRALLEALVQLVPGRVIRLSDVVTCLHLDATPRNVAFNATLREARGRFEREYISAVIEHHGGRITEAASALGIERTNLYRKMRSLGIDRAQAGKRRPS